MTIRIDKHIPSPLIKRKVSKRKPILPLDKMMIGDSCFVAETIMPIPTVRAELSHFRTQTSKEFTGRTVTENGVKGTRIWRLM